MSHGCNLGWISPALPELLSNNTPLVTGPLTVEQLAFVGSMNSIAAICGSFVVGLFSVLWGSWRATELIAFPAITVWLFIHFGDTFYSILFARFAVGLCGGSFQSGVVLYISEISNDK